MMRKMSHEQLTMNILLRNSRIRPFQEILTTMRQNAHTNNLRQAMVCDVYFRDFIKGIMHIYSIFKKPKTNVFILHLLTF